MSESSIDCNRGYTVYAHIAPNGKMYIGATCQKCEERWRNGSGYKGRKFYNAVKEFGWDNIKHEIIAENLTEDEAYKKEKELIQLYNTTDERCGYNSSTGGKYGGSGVQFTDERKKTIGKRMHEFMMVNNHFKGKHHTEKARKLMSENHYNCCGENNSFYGKHHTEETKKKISESRKGIYCGEKASRYGAKDTQEQIERKRLLKSKPIDMYDMNKNYIKSFLNSIEAEKETGCNHSNITRVCKGKSKSIHGYIFRYKGEAI